MSFDQRIVSSGVTSVVCLSLLLSACAAPCRCPASSAASGSAATAAADSPSAERVTRTEASGVIYDLQGCWKSGRNDVRCEYMGVSPKVDRKKILLAGNCGSRGQTAFDDQGNQYRSLKVSFGGHGVNCVYGALFLADTPVKIGVLFQNVASDATQLTALAFLDTRFTQFRSNPSHRAPRWSTQQHRPAPKQKRLRRRKLASRAGRTGACFLPKPNRPFADRRAPGLTKAWNETNLAVHVVCLDPGSFRGAFGVRGSLRGGGGDYFLCIRADY